MKYSITLGIALFCIWLMWSGHFLSFYEDGFVVLLGILSSLFCLYLSMRMKIVDDEGAPVQLGIRPFTSYAPWLIKEIIVSNIEVTKIILSRKMPLHRNMITVKAHQKTELGRVILANSITLTPGTVSVHMEGDMIEVHALSFEGAEEDLSGVMDRRISRLEGLSESLRSGDSGHE